MAGVVIALGGPWTLGPLARGALARGSAVVVDLSQPAAIPPEMVDLLGARLVTADDVARIGAQLRPASEGSRARLDALIDGVTEDFLAWLAARSGRDAAALLVDHADREREAELAELWRRHPGFGPEARAEIEAMTRHLARRILRGPLERLGRDADGRDAQAARDLFSL
jgi:glutamyl-tRNA reductase